MSLVVLGSIESMREGAGRTTAGADGVASYREEVRSRMRITTERNSGRASIEPLSFDLALKAIFGPRYRLSESGHSGMTRGEDEPSIAACRHVSSGFAVSGLKRVQRGKCGCCLHLAPRFVDMVESFDETSLCR